MGLAGGGKPACSARGGEQQARGAGAGGAMGPSASHKLGGTRGEELHLVLPQCRVTPTIVRDIAGQHPRLEVWTKDEKSCRETDRFSFQLLIVT